MDEKPDQTGTPTDLRVLKPLTEAMGCVEGDGDVELAAGVRAGGSCRARGSISVRGSVKKGSLTTAHHPRLDQVAKRLESGIRDLLDHTTPDWLSETGAVEVANRLLETSRQVASILDRDRMVKISVTGLIGRDTRLEGPGWVAFISDDLVGPLEITQDRDGLAIVKLPAGPPKSLSNLAEVTHSETRVVSLRSLIDALSGALTGPGGSAGTRGAA